MEDDRMLDSMERSPAASRQRLGSRLSRAMLICEALERRELLSRGMGLDALGGMGFGRHFGSLQAELGGFAGGRPGAMFGAGNLGVGGGMRSPIFLLTASLLTSGNGSTSLPSRSVLSSSSVQSAFQTLQTDLNNDITVGSKPTHATVGQLEDDLQAIRKGTLTGSAATTAIQNDEAAILTSMGLSSSQVSQIQSHLQAVQSAIQSASSSPTSTTTGGTTSTSSGGTTTGGTTSPANPTTPTSSSAVQSAFQALQTDLKNDLSSNAQPTNVSIGQVMDDMDAVQKGTLSGSSAVTTIQTDTAAVWSSMGLTQNQITQIQSDQTALASAIQASSGSSSSSTSSGASSSASPTSITAVEATMQSVQPYLIDVPGVGGVALNAGGYGGPGMGGFARSRVSGFAGSGGGGPVVLRMNGQGGMGGGGGLFISRTNGAVGPAMGGPVVSAMNGLAGTGMGGPVVFSMKGQSGMGMGGPVVSAMNGPAVLATGTSSAQTVVSSGNQSSGGSTSSQ
jgi:hypothetical protein